MNDLFIQGLTIDWNRVRHMTTAKVAISADFLTAFATISRV